MTATRSLLARLPELALEALMVVFAVLVALAVEEWRDERQMHEFADRARMGVVTELRANLDEFEETGPGLLATDAMLREVTQEEDFSLLANFNLGLRTSLQRPGAHRKPVRLCRTSTSTG